MKLKSSFGFGIEDLKEPVVIAVEDIQPEDEEEIVVLEPEEIEGRSDADVIGDAIDEVSELSEGLESFYDLVEQFQATGGMSRQAALALELGIKNTCKNWIPTQGLGVALESFDSDDDRVAATDFALESISDSLTAAWDKIKSLSNKWAVAMAQWWDGIIPRAKKLEKMADGIIAKAKAHEGVPKEKEVKLFLEEIRNISVNNDCGQDVKKVIEGLKELSEEIVKFPTREDAWLAKLRQKEELEIKLADAVEAAESYEQIKAKITHVDEAIKEICSTLGFKTGDVAGYKDMDTLRYCVSEPFIGERRILIELDGNKDGVWIGTNIFWIDAESEIINKARKAKFYENVAKFVVGGIAGEITKHAIGRYKAPALNAAEIGDLATQAKLIASIIAEHRVDFGKRLAVGKAQEEEMDKLYKALKKSDTKKVDKQLYATLKEVLTGSSNIIKACSQPESDLVKQALASTSASLNYCAKSLNNLKKGKPSEESFNKTEDEDKE